MVEQTEQPPEQDSVQTDSAESPTTEAPTTEVSVVAEGSSAASGSDSGDRNRDSGSERADKNAKNAKKAEKSGSSGRGGRQAQRGDGGRRRRDERSDEPQLIEKLVSINRVAKVVKGGRRFGFAALVVVGDGSGQVGHGAGKAREVPEAIRKATEDAKRTMIRVPLREGRTLHHDIQGRFDAGRVVLRAAPPGTGIIAGGPMRAVFESLGVQDVVAKSVGSSNPHNMIRATFSALQNMNSPRSIATKRGLKSSDIVGRRAGTSTNA